jgi:hypothetical protein
MPVRTVRTEEPIPPDVIEAQLAVLPAWKAIPLLSADWAAGVDPSAEPEDEAPPAGEADAAPKG